MGAVNPKSICEQAQVYYHEYLRGRAQERIPAEILTHIDKCCLCRSGVNRLKKILAEFEKHIAESTSQTSSVVTAILGLHYAYLGAPVTCKTVKPFLPSLADAAMKIGVSTPITVHIAKCQQCANALEAIRQLNLTGKQLRRLGQLFAEEPAADAKVCAKARNAIPSVVAMVFGETTGEVLKHLCTCPDCRQAVYKERQARIKKLPGEIPQSPIPCDGISATDIFDYVVPYGIDLGHDQYAMFRQPLTSHLINCAKCLGKMQQLHNSVYSILKRQESGIVTCFKIDTSAQGPTMSNPADAHKDWPIVVRAFKESREADNIETRNPVAETPRNPKQRLSTVSIRPFIKPAAVAAAVLLVAILLLKGPTAKAINLGQIYKALEQIKNVHLIRFVPEKPEPTQEIWISQALNTMLLKTETQWVLRDIKDKSQKSRDLNTGSIKFVELNDDTLAKVRQTMNTPWDLLPFDDISALPKDAKWQKVSGKNIDTPISNTEVYDLMWMEKSLCGSIVYIKWRGYVDTETTLLRRAEWWQRCIKEEGYQLSTVTNVTYPSTAEIRAVIKDAGF
jgi:hypothetical protein